MELQNAVGLRNLCDTALCMTTRSSDTSFRRFAQSQVGRQQKIEILAFLPKIIV